ncbi:MAG TPA: Asp-tRNA(Asn)/Glu-tRNA(Gln) amidotransferase subunit GatC [Candidatus Paceibacterota bacterium]|jgi:aspartyl-tRNA(Asn)/glutamyl-tRNA(Gln) amidotransferase subunit C|nr:Asp-tRNA(Asn)/Glu-tRNA(Gln) amidotransferase subunit GatC [Candidatus Paceibacterota bacterium]
MDIKDVSKLAELARIELSEEEKGEILKDMENILGYIKQIEEVKVEDEMPEYNTYNVWREDEIRNENSPEASKFSAELIIEQFPDSQDGFLKVKKIL